MGAVLGILAAPFAPAPPVPAFEPLVAPRDEEDYTTSFPMEDVEGIHAFFDKYGFVVIRDILTPEEAAVGLDSIWRTIEKPGKLERDKPDTWKNFPSGSQVGILGNTLPGDVFAWGLRQHPRLHQAYATVLHETDLMVSLDRYGFMRPTKAIRMADGEVVDRPEWQSAAQWFHWDLNPWNHIGNPRLTEDEERDFFTEENGEFSWNNELEAIRLFVTENNHRPEAHFGRSTKVQGLVALLDAPEHAGGFICVPGFHRYLDTWVKAHRKSTNAPYVPVSHDASAPVITGNAQKIPMRQGSVCIWNSRLPHCNFPNDSSQFRACFYVKMFPRWVLPVDLPGFMEARARALSKSLPANFVPSKLGIRLLGLDALQVRGA